MPHNMFFNVNSTNVNPSHRTALYRAVNRVNKQIKVGDSSTVQDGLIIVGTKNIIRNFILIVFTKRPHVLYFTGFGRLYTDYGFIGRLGFNTLVWVLGMMSNVLSFICENRDDVAHLKFITNAPVFHINGSGFEHYLRKPLLPRRKGNGKKGFNPTNIRLGYMSRFGKSKCTDEIIKLALTLPQGCHLVVAGKDIKGHKYTKKFYQLAAQHQNIIMLGFLETPMDVNMFFNSIDVFLYPSKREGLPITLLESIFHGIPFVTTRVPGCDELAAHFGCVNLEWRNFSQDIETALAQLADYDPEYARRRLAKYEVAAVQAQFEELLSKCITLKSPAS